MTDKPQIHLTDQLHRAIHAGLLHEVKKLINDGANMDHVLGMRGTALCSAIEAKSVDIVRYLLEKGCDVNAQDYDGEPPILLALRKDSIGHISGRVPSFEIVQAIIEHQNCNVNKLDPITKKAAIHFAVEQGMTEVVGLLIDKSGPFKCIINAADLNGNTALHLAVHEGVSESVQMLVNHPECLIKVYNKAGITPIHICANNGDAKSLDILLKRLRSTKNKRDLDGDHGSDLDLTINAVTLFEKESSLHHAVRNGHEEVVSMLLDNGAQVNLENNLNNTPLMLSLVSVKQWQSMSNVIPKALLEKGANPNVQSEVRSRFLKSHLKATPLIISIFNGNLDLVKSLLKSGADVNMVDNFGNTPLIVALNEGQQEIASFLLTECKKLNINAQNVEGESCLHATLKCFKKTDSEKSKLIVKQLMKAGAEILEDSDGQTVMMRALDYENHIILDTIFEETGVSAQQYIKSKDNNWVPGVSIVSGVFMYSLIHAAVAEGLLDIVKVLLSHGADIDDTTTSGESTLYIALEYQQYEIVRYLVENGCSFVNDSYIFIDKEISCKPTRNNDMELDSSDSDSADDSECDDLDLADVFPGNHVFADNHQLKLWIREVALTPRSLKLQSLITIRKCFVAKHVSLSKVDSLNIPDTLKACIRYKK